MRLFTGIAIDPQVLEKLWPTLKKLQASAALNWSRPENLHITTKFIGEWPEAKLDKLNSALTQVAKRKKFEIALEGFGFFPNPTRPRVFFARVNGGDALPKLAADIEDACEEAGCPRENRDYSPHMTLAKIRNAKVSGLRDAMAPFEHSALGSFLAGEFTLYLSTPSAAGSIYTALAKFGIS